jgi:hypothetical protein
MGASAAVELGHAHLGGSTVAGHCSHGRRRATARSNCAPTEATADAKAEGADLPQGSGPWLSRCASVTRPEVCMPRDEAEYASLRAEFQAKHGPVRIRVTRGARLPKPSALDVFPQAWESARGLPAQRRFKFHPDRGWTFDFAWPPHRLALELEGLGAGGGGGRHHLPAGIIADCEKFNAALLMGWRVLRVPSRGSRRQAMGRARAEGPGGAWQGACVNPTIRYVDVPARALVRCWGSPVDRLELFRRKTPDGAIPVCFGGILWLRLDDADRFRAHYLLDEPCQGEA